MKHTKARVSLIGHGTDFVECFRVLFFAREVGSCLSREKEWKSITAAGYSEGAVPLIDGVVLREPGHHVMQNKAPPHKAGQTMRGFMERRFLSLNGHHAPLGLNPIESVWDFMEDYMQRKYSELG